MIRARLGASARVRIVTALIGFLVSVNALGVPSDSVPPGGATGNTRALGFDVGCAPTPAQGQAWWDQSPYWFLGLYVGGSNVYCSPPPASTVSSLNDQGWGFLPIWVGPQAPSGCQLPGQSFVTFMSPDTTVAVNQGKAEADAAAAAAINLGFAAGTVIYYDIEGWNTAGAGCNQPVHEFLNGWVYQLRTQHAMKPAIYGSSCSSNSIDWATLPNQPDAVWLAWYSGPPTVWNILCTDAPPHANTYWVGGQRAHQYTNTHQETYGGVSLDIANDCADGLTAARGRVAATASCPIQNDFFSTAAGIGTADTVYGHTRTANFEVGEPQPCGAIGGTVWYSAIQPTAGRYVFSSVGTGTGFDTVIAVHSGSSLSGLTKLDCNDDSDGTQASRASAYMNSNVGYSVQVGGYNDARGNYGVTMRPAVYGASWAGQQYPPTMTSGQVASAWLDYRNDGNYVWTSTTRIGTTQPRDHSSPFYDSASWIAPNRASDPDLGQTCGPGVTCRFSFQLRAPVVPEPVTYTIYWGILQEGEMWFGPPDSAVWFQITVNP